MNEALSIKNVRPVAMLFADAPSSFSEMAQERELMLINDEKFTKTANCGGVDNNAKGTNTNRVALFRKS